MGDEPDGDDSSDDKERVSVTVPKDALEQLVAGSPMRADYQDGIEAAIETQLEIDAADEYHIVKNRE